MYSKSIKGKLLMEVRTDRFTPQIDLFCSELRFMGKICCNG